MGLSQGFLARSLKQDDLSQAGRSNIRQFQGKPRGFRRRSVIVVKPLQVDDAAHGPIVLDKENHWMPPLSLPRWKSAIVLRSFAIRSARARSIS